MATAVNSRLEFSLRTLSKALGIIIMLVGSLVLADWVFDVRARIGVLPGLSMMKANMAIGFLLAGCALWFAGREVQTAARRIARRFCAALVTLIGLLALGKYLAGTDLLLDQSIFDSRTPAGAFLGRMPLSSAVTFTLVGIALLTIDVEVRRGFRPAQAFSLASGFISSLALLGYLYDVQSLYQVGATSSMALHTALSFSLISLGALCARPAHGVMHIVTASTAGGVILRRSFPLAILILILLGRLRLWGQHAGIYNTNFGAALLVLASVVLVGIIIWLIAGWLHREEIERRRTEEAIREADVRYSTLVEQMPNAIVYVHSAEVTAAISYISPQVEGMLGFSRREWQANPGLWVERLHPEDRSQTLMASDRHNRTGQPFNQVYRLLSRDGRVVWVQDTAIMVRDESSRPKYSQGVMVDITQRKEAEEKALRLNAELEERVRLRTAQLESANKELEAFSYSVSHDLRAPLRAIDGFSRILLEDYGPQLDAEAKRYLNTVRGGTQQMGHLIEDLLAFSRASRQPLDLKNVSLADIAREAMASIRAEQEGRAVEVTIGSLPPCRGDPNVLRQVFVNLLSNALKFTRTRAKPHVQIGSLPAEQGEEVYFVKDNGVGFDMRYAGKLFGVFQRLHRAEEFEGTGVGLAFVQRIIHRHGGRIWAEAEVEKGATFYFSLPARETPSAKRPADEDKESTIAQRVMDLI